eukprot:COSAG04_NODE_842_length_9945_cov_4.243043_2_plen_208_part_00
MLGRQPPTLRLQSARLLLTAPARHAERAAARLRLERAARRGLGGGGGAAAREGRAGALRRGRRRDGRAGAAAWYSRTAGDAHSTSFRIGAARGATSRSRLCGVDEPEPGPKPRHQPHPKPQPKPQPQPKPRRSGARARASRSPSRSHRSPSPTRGWAARHGLLRRRSTRRARRSARGASDWQRRRPAPLLMRVEARASGSACGPTSA